VILQAPQRRPFQPYRWAGRQLCQVIRTTNQTVSMTLLLVPLLIMFTFAAVHAATSYTVTNDSQCITFLSAIGATGDPTSAQCYVYQGTLPAGDTLTLTDGWSLRPQGTGAFPGTNFINRGTITGALYNAGTFENRGVITLTDTGNNRSGGLINNYGTMVVDAPLIHTGTINNQGTIIVTCNGRINSTGGTITGNTIQEQGNCDYPVANDSQCTAFLSAIGATGQPTTPQCYVFQGTLPAGDTLTLTGGWSLRPQSTGAFPGTNFINYGTITGALYNAGTFENRGVITLTDTGSNRTGGVIDNYGTMVVDAPLIHTGTINNQGTLMVTCNGTINSTGTITGNPLINLCETIRPRANPTPNPPANGNGWHNSDVTVLWNWTDNAGGSGIDAANCVATSSSSSEGIQILSATCTDLAGNTGNATYQVRIDKSRPTVNPAPNPPANANGWSNRDVTVAWNWFDNGSGVDPATCPPTTLVTGEGRTTLDQICFDRAGNEMRSLYTVNLDKTLPTANPTQSPTANANGWNNSDVTVTWNWRDPSLSAGQAAGLDPTNCPLTTTSSGEGNPQLNGQCRDLADNRTEQNYTVLVDKTAPVVTITGVSNGAVYTLGSVPTAACNTTDTRSGVATQATLSVTGGNPDGTGNFTATCSGATDLAGNSGSASVIYTVNAPSTPTSTSTSSPTPTPTATATNTPTPTLPPVTPGAATITIVLDVQPNASTNYSFSSSFGAFRLDDAGADDGDSYTNSRSFLVTAGRYSVSRTPTTGRFTTAITCTPADRAAVDLLADRATLTVSAGDNLTCTFVVERSSTIRARVFEDLVRNKANLGKRNAGDPWLQGWSINLFSSPTTPPATQLTAPTATAGLYEAVFTNLRPGTYALCSAIPSGTWIFTTPSALDPRYGLPCKPVTLDPGQSALLLFGAYQATAPALVVAADSAEAVITDEEQISDLPYDPAEEELIEKESDAALANRLFLPLVNR